MARRRRGLKADDPRFITTMSRRVDKEHKGKTLSTLASRIARKTQDINWQYKKRDDDMVAMFDSLIEKYENDPAAKRNVEMAKSDYMRNHTDKNVHLKNLAGKVRTTREAKEILRRLDNHVIEASDERMKDNYIKALEGHRFDRLIKRIKDMPIDEFLEAYYLNMNAAAVFLVYGKGLLDFIEASELLADEDAFVQSWEDTLNIVEGSDTDNSEQQ